MRSPLARNNVTIAGNQRASKTLVFVNGLGTDQTAWSRIVPAFEDEFRVVLFDHVGSVPSNQSDFKELQSRYINVNGYALDLLDVVDAVRPEGQLIAVGHSLGAMACLLASIERPGLFSKLVLLGASPRYQHAPGYQGGFSKDDIDVTYSAILSNYSSWSTAFAEAAMANADRPDLSRRLAGTLATIPADMMLTVLCSIMQMDHRRVLTNVSLPVLLIQSRKDFFVPMEVAKFLHKEIAGSELRLIDVEGHLPHISAPEAVVEAMRSFLGKI